MAPERPENPDFPRNWDRLSERGGEIVTPRPASSEPSTGGEPMTVSLFAAVWADTVTITAVCTLALLALVSLGYQAAIPAVPWAAGLGLMWWCAAAITTLVVRRGTPGMLMAGVVFGDRIRPGRIVAVLVVSLILCATCGILAMVGAQRSLLRLAAGQPLATADITPAAS
jgi:hypothetical protein